MQIEPLEIYPQPPGCCDPCKDPANYPNYAKEAREAANAAAAASAAAKNFSELAEDALDDFVNYAYSKAETDELLDSKADSSDLEDYYTKAETDALLTDYYDKSATDSLLAAKADASALADYYTKSESDTLWATKANVSDLNDYYTKTAADSLLAAKADASALNDYYTKSQSEAIDISNKFTIPASLAADINVVKVYYEPVSKIVSGTLFLLTSSGTTVATSSAYFNIDAAYRPANNIDFGGLIRANDRSTLSLYRITFTSSGIVKQALTATSTGIYCSFKYKI